VTSGLPAPPLPLAAARMERWRLSHDAVRHRLALVPPLLPEGREELGPFRAGRSVLTLEIRRRRDALVLRVRLSYGPPIRIDAGPPDGFGAATAEVDGTAMGRLAVGFEAAGEHEVIWRR
jgi:hypothetical protein